MGDSLPRTPMNYRAKFDTSSFIFIREICNRTNKNKQTVTDISTPCLLACVDNKCVKPNHITSERAWLSLTGHHTAWEYARCYNNNNNNPICKAPECQKTSVALFGNMPGVFL